MTEQSAMAAVRRHFMLKMGVAGPTVAQAEQVIAALREADMLKKWVKP